MARRLLVVAMKMSKLYVLIFVGVVACGFSSAELEVQPDAQPSQVLDAASSSDSTLRSTPCHSQLPGVMLCFDFEDPTLDPTIQDDSSGGHTATSSDVTNMAHGLQQAAMIDEQSSIRVPEAPALDLSSALSMEMWIEPSAHDQDSTIFWHSDDFGIDYEGGQVGCYNGGDEAWNPLPTTPGWHHVACTFDGQTIETYIDGSVVSCVSSDPRDTHAEDLHIGGDYEGGVDDVHLYNRALAPEEVELLAAVTSGVTTCPGG
jgi:concanavalin A-like lectin/glucanase superfamily protein